MKCQENSTGSRFFNEIWIANSWRDVPHSSRILAYNLRLHHHLINDNEISPRISVQNIYLNPVDIMIPKIENIHYDVLECFGTKL